MTTRCKQEVATFSGWHFRRCLRAAVRDGFCKQHHPDTVAARAKAVEELWQKKRAADPLVRALNRVKALEAERDALKSLLEEMRPHLNSYWCERLDELLDSAKEKP